MVYGENAFGLHNAVSPVAPGESGSTAESRLHQYLHDLFTTNIKQVRFKRNFIGTKHFDSPQHGFGTWYQTVFCVLFNDSGGGGAYSMSAFRNTEKMIG